MILGWHTTGTFHNGDLNMTPYRSRLEVIPSLWHVIASQQSLRFFYKSLVRDLYYCSFEQSMILGWHNPGTFLNVDLNMTPYRSRFEVIPSLWHGVAFQQILRFLYKSLVRDLYYCSFKQSMILGWHTTGTFPNGDLNMTPYRSRLEVIPSLWHGIDVKI